MVSRPIICLLGLLFFCNGLAGAERTSCQLAAPFTPNMILQRDVDVPIWGYAEPDAKITVEFAGQSKTVNANKRGDWIVRLNALQSSKTERVMRIKEGNEIVIELGGVLVGEVWFSSGQSNMVWLANSSMCRDLATELARSEDDIPIREISIETVSALYPQKHATSTDGWKTHKQAGGFSALSLAFAYELYKDLDVPVGILLSAHSNTRIEAFTERTAIERHESLQSDVKLIHDADPLLPAGQSSFKKYYSDLRAWQKAATAAIDSESRLPARPGLPGIAGMWRGPTQFFNGKINPVVPYAIRGAIWCQGTSNSGDGRIYASRMEALLDGWRAAWGMPDMPFYFTQMQCYGTPDPNVVGFADIRQAQHVFFMNNRENVGMVVQSDLNSARPQGIHYFNKLHPGMRMARWALAQTYGKDVAYTGPIYAGYEVQNDKVVVSFEVDSLFGGLMVGSKGMAKDYQQEGAYVEPARESPDAELNHFRLCGEDRVWHPAKAMIVGEQVVVTSEQVLKPIGVQYAYSAVPENSNLYNKAGLPATPFAVIEGEFIFEEDDAEKVAAIKARYAKFTDPDYPILQVVEYFRDGAVIQRNQTIPIWGHANEGEEVTVTLGGVTKKTVANEAQQWALEFPPMAASSTPIELTLKSSHGFERVVRDILVGDVWYVTGSTQLTSELAYSNRNQDGTPPEAMPLVREFRRKTAASSFPTPRKRKFETGGGRYRSAWLTAEWESGHEGVSMFAYHFAKSLGRKGVPQGFITMSAGQGQLQASPLSWTSYAGVQKLKTNAFQSRLNQLFMQYANTDVAKDALDEHIVDVQSFVETVVKRSKNGVDETDGVPLSAPPFPEAGRSDEIPADSIPTYTYNWCISPMVPMAVAGVIWVPSKNSLGYEPGLYGEELEIFAGSLGDTFGLEGVPFIYAQPAAGLVEGLTAPDLPNSASIQFAEWPKTLAEIAKQLAEKVE